EKVQESARRASTEDLLNRVTVYRAGMEPEALAIIEAELLRRGVRTCDIEDYERAARESVLEDASGVGLRCSFCSAPAVRERWGWHRLWGTIPLSPRRYWYCREHDVPDPPQDPGGGSGTRSTGVSGPRRDGFFEEVPSAQAVFRLRFQKDRGHRPQGLVGPDHHRAGLPPALLAAGGHFHADQLVFLERLGRPRALAHTVDFHRHF